MIRPFRFALPLLLFATLLVSCAPTARTETQLNGEHVAQITQTFLRNHYSRAVFDDVKSREMLTTYIRRFDPGHYYFLQSDINEFQQYSTRLDNLLRKGDIEIAFRIFERYKQRLDERGVQIEELLKGKFDLKTEDRQLVDRSKESFPLNGEAARRLWARKLKFELLELVLSGTKEKEAITTLSRRYRSARLQTQQYTRNEVVSVFVNAFTASYDPHSTYLSPDARENFDISLRLSLEGIGATLRWEDGLTVVASIIAGGAAFREGSLKPGDKVVSVAQGRKGEFHDVRNMRLTEVVKLIRGKRGSTVRLIVLRKEEGPVEDQLEISIVRDKILLTEGEAKGRTMEVKRSTAPRPYRVGIVDLPSFYVDFSRRNSDSRDYKSSSRDVRKILADFKKKGVDGVVLDLRNNGGGGLDEAISLSGGFLNRGPVVMVKTVNGDESVYRNPHREPFYTGPLLVVTNRYSASASEILAGALQDYGRAILVGDSSTFGKGTVQNIIELQQGMGALKTTVAKFYRPGASSTQNRGVVPDIVLPSINNHLEIGESSLENALPWDSIRPRDFSRWGNFSEFIPVLAERSRQRRSTNPTFMEIERRVKEYLALGKNRNIITVGQMIAQSEKGKKKTLAKPPHGKTNSKSDPKSDPKDGYLEEVVNILVDYVELAGQKTRPRVVNRAS